MDGISEWPPEAYIHEISNPSAKQRQGLATMEDGTGISTTGNGYCSEEEDMVLSKKQKGCSSSREPTGTEPNNQQASPPVITNHFDSVLECLDFLRMVESDDKMDKSDVIDAIRGRLHTMLSKILLSNSITSMSMMGWKLE